MAKILIVDDSTLSRKILRGILEPAGHEVMEAADGLAALERYALDRPDLVLLDLMMAGMPGLDVLAQLRQLDAGAQVVVATADIQETTRDHACSGGAISLINKPFREAQVRDAVSQCLAPREVS